MSSTSADETSNQAVEPVSITGEAVAAPSANAIDPEQSNPAAAAALVSLALLLVNVETM
jgi:hypothetical protein